MDKKWKVLIVDDDHDIHRALKLHFKWLVFQDRELNFLSAYSAQEGKLILEQNPDIALILLDVVMEDDHAGLEMVKYIRNKMGNHNVRIILRTGQPGMAPEADVIEKYEIDGYRLKGDEEDRIATDIKTALRAFQSLTTVDYYRQSLSRINSLEERVLGNKIPMIRQLKGVLPYNLRIMEEVRDILCGNDWDKSVCAGFYGMLRADNIPINSSSEDIITEITFGPVIQQASKDNLKYHPEGECILFSALGKYQERGEAFTLDEDVCQFIQESLRTKKDSCTPERSVFFFENNEVCAQSGKSVHILYLEGFQAYDHGLTRITIEKLYKMNFRVWGVL